MIGQKIRLRGE